MTETNTTYVVQISTYTGGAGPWRDLHTYDENMHLLHYATLEPAVAHLEYARNEQAHRTVPEDFRIIKRIITTTEDVISQ